MTTFIVFTGLRKPLLYKQSSSTKDINFFKDQLNDNPDVVDLNSCSDVHIICGVLKRYLRELPNPVIARENYSDFLQAIGRWFIREGGSVLKWQSELPNQAKKK